MADVETESASSDFMTVPATCSLFVTVIVERTRTLAALTLRSICEGLTTSSRLAARL
jgi:hypothetical protein